MSNRLAFLTRMVKTIAKFFFMEKILDWILQHGGWVCGMGEASPNHVCVCVYVCVCMCVYVCQNEKKVPDEWQARHAKIASTM